MVSISLGIALVAGKKRVPNPATGITAFLIAFMNSSLNAPLECVREQPKTGDQRGYPSVSRDDHISGVVAKKFRYRGLNLPPMLSIVL
jgi:hypothetical protein